MYHLDIIYSIQFLNYIALYDKFRFAIVKGILLYGYMLNKNIIKHINKFKTFVEQINTNACNLGDSI